MSELPSILFGLFAPYWIEIVLLIVGLRTRWRLHLIAGLLVALYFHWLIYSGNIVQTRNWGRFWIEVAGYTTHWAAQLAFLIWFLPRAATRPAKPLRVWQVSISELLFAMSLLGIGLTLPRALGFLLTECGLYVALIFLYRRGIAVRWRGFAMIALCAVAIMTGLKWDWIDSPFGAGWILMYWPALGALRWLIRQLVQQQSHATASATQ